MGKHLLWAAVIVIVVSIGGCAYMSIEMANGAFELMKEFFKLASKP